jgi:DNA-binding transcriptional regulator YiaG
MKSSSKSISKFSNRVKNLRSALGLTQRELATEFRVSHGAVALWESGARKLSGPITKLVEIYEQKNNIQSKCTNEGKL